MDFLGIEIQLKHSPVYDPGFIPMIQFQQAFLKRAKRPVSICIERNGGLRSVYDTYITGENTQADRYYIARLVKFLLWAKGGCRVFICGDEAMAAYIQEAYSPTGPYAFDRGFMEKLYERPFQVAYLPLSEKPPENEQAKPIGGNTKGCRIGFDAGGSDRKVSAVMDGVVVYSEEVVWHPKTAPNPDYHFKHIVEAMKKAAAQMPRVDSIGVSSAGIYINNRTMTASLFLKVPAEDFDKQVRDIYIRAAREIGDVPLTVVNDGDVTALAGAMELGDSHILGIAMGTSQAGGFIDENGKIKGWLNELAFAPVDASPRAAIDEWSGDIGCGVQYFSQDAVIKLAKKAGIDMEASLSPGEKLKLVQNALVRGEKRKEAADIFRSIGVYLGHTLPFYWTFYGFRHVLLLGRVMSGRGGDIILDTAKQVIAEAYSGYRFQVHTLDETARRVGQSVAAASL